MPSWKPGPHKAHSHQSVEFAAPLIMYITNKGLSGEELRARFYVSGNVSGCHESEHSLDLGPVSSVTFSNSVISHVRKLSQPYDKTQY